MLGGIWTDNISNVSLDHYCFSSLQVQSADVLLIFTNLNICCSSSSVWRIQIKSRCVAIYSTMSSTRGQKVPIASVLGTKQINYLVLCRRRTANCPREASTLLYLVFCLRLIFAMSYLPTM